MNLAQRGVNLNDVGYVGLSKKKKNQVISNVLGAAAYNGATDILKSLLVRQKASIFNVNFLALEKQDFNQKGNFVKEMLGFTPLMLAVSGGISNKECMQILLGAKADASIKDTYGNGLLHLAAIYSNYEALDFLVKNVPTLNVSERNNKGDTPLSIL